MSADLLCFTCHKQAFSFECKNNTNNNKLVLYYKNYKNNYTNIFAKKKIMKKIDTCFF